MYSNHNIKTFPNISHRKTENSKFFPYIAAYRNQIIALFIEVNTLFHCHRFQFVCLPSSIMFLSETLRFVVACAFANKTEIAKSMSTFLWKYLQFFLLLAISNVSIRVLSIFSTFLCATFVFIVTHLWIDEGKNVHDLLVKRWIQMAPLLKIQTFIGCICFSPFVLLLCAIVWLDENFMRFCLFVQFAFLGMQFAIYANAHRQFVTIKLNAIPLNRTKTKNKKVSNKTTLTQWARVRDRERRSSFYWSAQCSYYVTFISNSRKIFEER